jgi:PAS domain S-box-containing protein
MKNVKRTSKQLIMKVDEFSHSLLENTPHPITAINPDTSIMYVNPAFEKLTGFSLPEIIGRQAPYPWWPEETRAKRLPALKKLMAGTNKTIEQTIQNKNGELFLVQLSMVRVVEKGIFKYHLAYWHDITERKRAEEALIENEEKYRMLVEDALIGIMNVDLTGKITYVNNTIVHETGYSQEELIGKNAFRLGLITREMIKVLRKRMKEKLTGQPPGLLQLQFKCKDGRWIWLQIRGKLIRKHNIPVGIQIFGEEITERKQAEATLMESEEKYRVLHNTMAQGVAYQDKTGKVVSMNTAAERILGVQLEQIANVETINTNLITIHEDGSEYSAEQHPTMVSLRTGKPVKDAIMGIYHPQEDDYRWVIINTIPQFKPGEDKPYQVFVTFADITKRKKAEEALRESRERFRIASQIASDVVYERDIRTGIATFYGDIDSHLGYEPGGYPRSFEGWREHVHPDDLAWLDKQSLDQLEPGIPFSIEYRMRKKDGTYMTWLDKVIIIKDDETGKPVKAIGVATDITERKRAEEALRQSEERYRSFVQNFNGIAYRGNINFEPEFFHGNVKKMTGYTEQDFMDGKIKWDRIIHKDDLPECLRKVKERIQHKPRAAESEFRIVHRDGSIRWIHEIFQTIFDDSGEVIGSQGIQHDITERKQAEEKLRESEEKLRRILETVSDGLTVTDLSGVITEVNDAILRLGGFSSKDAVIGKNAFESIDFPDRERALTDMLELAQQGALGRSEYNLLRADGSSYPAEISANVLKDAAGNPAGFVSMIRDITERKQAEEKVSHLNLTLHSIRNINQLITREKDRSKLLGNVCKNLVDTQSCFYAWVALLDESSKLLEYAESNIGKDFLPILKKLQAGVLPVCARDALRQSDVVVIKDTLTKCRECPLALKTNSHARLSVRLEHEGKTYGILCAAVPPHVISNSEELTLFKEVADDIAFALHDMELEEERQQAEEALRKSEEKFSRAFRSSPDRITITTLDGGRFIDVNDSYIRYTGYSREEVIGHTTRELGSWPDPHNREKIVKKLKEQGSVSNEEVHLRIKSGEIRTSLISSEQIEINGEQCMISVATDITERKQAEEALRESEEKFSRAFRSSPDRIAITTLDDGRFIDVNDSYVHFAGYTREEVIGHTSKEFNSWPNPHDREKIVKKLKEQGRVYNEEVHLRNKSGEIRTSLFSAEPIEINGEQCMISVATDITERKQAEEALSESERRYRDLAESISDVFFAFDKDLRYTYWNRASEELTGVSAGDALGKHLYDVFKDDEATRKAEKAYRRALRAKKPQHFIRDYKINDKEYIFEISAYPSKDGLSVFTKDVTERKQAEEALRESEEFSTSLLENSPDPIIVINPDSSIRYVNPALENLTGFSRAEVTGRKTPYPWWTEETLKKTNRDLKEAMHKGAKGLKELFQKKSGEFFWVDITSTPVMSDGKFKYYMANWVDITERKHAEEALRESEEKFSKAFQSSPDIISIASLKDGKYIEVNDSFTRISGYSREEVIGKTTTELNTWASPEERDRMLRRLLEKGHIRNEEYIVRSKSGKLQNVLISAEVIEVGGEPCIISVVTDITERREAEEKLREAATLRELDRLRTELLANISHELRTPLSSIKGFATVLLEYENKLKRHEKREYLETIDKNTDRLVELIEQLLDMSRLGAGMLSIEKSPTSISKLFQEVLAEVQVRAPAHRFALDLPARLPRAHIDAKRIRQVLDNLTDNAVKHSRAGTEITIRARKKGDEILVAVIDQGTGIPKNILPRVFERLFSSGKRHISGTSGIGLGLSICKGLVEAHGGRIWIESEEGRGTTCFFTLPIYQRPGNDYGKKG